MELEASLKELGTKLGLPDLALDDNGACRLEFDEEIAVQIQRGSDGEIQILGPLIVASSVDRDELLPLLLEANFLGQGTGGASFAYEPETGSYFLQALLQEEQTDALEFEKAVENLVNQLEAWQKAVDKMGQAEPEVSDELPPAGSVSAMMSMEQFRA